MFFVLSHACGSLQGFVHVGTTGRLRHNYLINLKDGKDNIKSKLEGPGLGIKNVPNFGGVSVLDLSVVTVNSVV
jgi:hypothetical protein